jgi:MOSC domain-containing protein YiiM
MVTREINADIPQDRSILRHIVRDLNQNLGVYARIIQPGPVSMGDTVQFLK